MKLSKNFSLAEFIKSNVAIINLIGNTPNDQQIRAIKILCEKVLQPARDGLGFALEISSGFRSEELNIHIGGATNSQHMKGEAADLNCQDNAKLFHFIKDNLPFDQLIWEMGNDEQPDWVHVSFTTGQLRGQVLRAHKTNAGTKYTFWREA
jgi:zinc D-Ala-D-Ala carboxypeptidase